MRGRIEFGRLRLIALVGVLIGGHSALAQWVAIELFPEDADHTDGLALSGDKQFGAISMNQWPWQAAMWNGTPESMLNLHPQGAMESIILGASSTDQVGLASFGWGQPRKAIRWQGTPESFVVLHPNEEYRSQANDSDGQWQVGYVSAAGQPAPIRAALWQGSAQSYVSLHPMGAVWSSARAVHNGQQVGVVEFPNPNDFRSAALWTGSADSFVDLSVPNYNSSSILGVYDGCQGGAISSGQYLYATIWFGTAESYQIIAPPGEQISSVAAVHSGMQAGYAGLHAAFWSGNSESYVDLHSFLLPGFQNSNANDISHSGEFTYVIGTAQAQGPYMNKAILWVRENTAYLPESLTTLRGVVEQGNLGSILESDDTRLVYRPGPVLISSDFPVQVVVETTSPQANPALISFRLEASASAAAIQQKIWLFNFDKNQYIQYDARSSTTSDQKVVVTEWQNADAFIDDSTGKMRAKIGYKATGPILVFPWRARIDEARWYLPPD